MSLHRALILIFGLATFASVPAMAQQPSLDQRVKALEDYVNGSPDRTIAEKTGAIAKDPKNAQAYFERGRAREDSGDLDGAIADYTEALKLDPKNADAYYFRAETKRYKHDFDGAIADMSQLIALKPGSASAYYGRGVNKADKGDFDGAITDYTQSLSQSQDGVPRTLAYANRGQAKEFKGDLDGAIADFNQVLQLRPNDTYPHFNLWIAKAKHQQKTEADKELADYLARRQTEDSADMGNQSLENLRKWETKVGKFLLGQESETDFLAAGASNTSGLGTSQLGEAWYFVGIKKLLAGDKVAAAEAFRKVPATELKDSPYCLMAQAELRALGK